MWRANASRGQPITWSSRLAPWCTRPSATTAAARSLLPIIDERRRLPTGSPPAMPIAASTGRIIPSNASAMTSAGGPATSKSQRYRMGPMMGFYVIDPEGRRAEIVYRLRNLFGEQTTRVVVTYPDGKARLLWEEELQYVPTAVARPSA